MGWEFDIDLDVGFKHTVGKKGDYSVSARHEFSILNWDVTHTVTASRGKLEYVGLESSRPTPTVVPEVVPKVGAVKADIEVRKGLVVGGTVGTDGSIGFRGGIGTKDVNVYAEVSAKVGYTETATEELRRKESWDDVGWDAAWMISLVAAVNPGALSPGEVKIHQGWLENHANQTGGPRGTGYDPHDPRGPWQEPGAPGDRTPSTTHESWADRHGGGAGDSGRVGGAVSDHSTTATSTKNSDGYTKVTKTTKYTSGVTQTTTTQTISTPSGPQTITKVTTTPVSKPADEPRNGVQPILLDLDGNGVKITEFQNSTQFMTGKDGLSHRTSWAAAGDGVLFYDPDGRNAITEERQYVFTEWNATAQGDLEALRSVWDTNGDGKLTAADAEFAKFKVMVTNADGSTSVMTLAALGITEINLTANAVNIALPDGSVITGQTTFTRANGTTGTVANTALTAVPGAGGGAERVGLKPDLRPGAQRRNRRGAPRPTWARFPAFQTPGLPLL